MKNVSVFRIPERGWLQGFTPNPTGEGLIAVFSDEYPGLNMQMSHIAALHPGSEMIDQMLNVPDIIKIDVEVAPEHLYQNCRIEVDFLSKYGLDFGAHNLLANREPAGSC